MAAPDAHISGNLINQFAQDHDVDLNVDDEARRNLVNQFASQHDVDLNVDDEARGNLVNQFARQHDVDLNVDDEARGNLLNQFARQHDVGLNVNQFAPVHNIKHQALRSLGLFLVFIGASIIVGAIPQHSDIITEDIFMAFTAFVLGVLLISLSLVVNYYNVTPRPRAAAFVDAVLNHSLVVIAICLTLIHL